MAADTMSYNLFNSNIRFTARHKVDARTILRNPAHLLAFGFGAGLSPVVPATVGTLIALPLYWIIDNLSVELYIAVVAAMALLGIGLCSYTSRALEVDDHSGIVWDEIVGYLVTMTAIPQDWMWMMLGFLLFRLFDILKPWPISWCDRNIKGGLGIMLDDCLAGLLACGILHGGNILWTRFLGGMVK